MKTATIEIQGVGDLVKAFNALGRKHAPTAVRNTLQDIASAIVKREEQEIKRVFDRPTPMIQRAFFAPRVQKGDTAAFVRLKDVFGKLGDVVPNTLEPHIPGYAATRQAKGMETALRRKGLMGDDEYLVPSRTMRLNKYGNLTGAKASKMLNDLWAFSNVSGFKSSTGDAKRKYVFGTIYPAGREPIKGIWDTKRFQAKRPNALQMLVVKGAPQYAKRFRYYQIGQSYARSVAPAFTEREFKRAIARAMRK